VRGQVKKLSKEELKSNDHIPTKEILQDIADTQKEIGDYSDEQKVLMRNPQENKVKVYILKGRISGRKEFIDKLNQVIEYRRRK